MSFMETTGGIMSWRAIGNFFCAVITLIILSVPGQASELSKGHYRSPALSGSKPVAKPVLKPSSSRIPVISKKPVHKKIRLLPDLVVKRVLLQNGKLIFTIKNRGRGSITASAFRRGVVQIHCNSGKQTLSFVKRTGHHPAVDPNGHLQHPGGAITYSTSFKPPVTPGTRAVVTVTVDSNHRISEQNERNNTGKTTYQIPIAGKIRIDKRHPVASSPLPHARSLQKTKHPPLSALKIERIYLKKNRVHIRIRNTTRRILTTSDLMSTWLQLYADKKHRSWLLAKIDGKHALRRAGGSLDFDTSLVLDRQTHVTARLERKGLVKTARALLAPVGGIKFKSTAALLKKKIRPNQQMHKIRTAPELTNRFNKQDKKPGKRNPRTAGMAESAATGLTIKTNSLAAMQDRSRPQPELPDRLLEPTPGGGDLGTPLQDIARLEIINISLTPEQPRKNQQATLNVIIKNTGFEEMPYPCNCSVVSMVCDQVGTRGSWGNPVIMVSANAANVPLITPNGEQTIHIPLTFPEAGYHTLIVELHTDAGHLCQPEEDGRRVTINPQGLRRLLLVYARGGTPKIDLTLSELRRGDAGRLYLTMFSQGEQAASIPDEDFNNAIITIRIEKTPTGHVLSGSSIISAGLRDIDPNGLLRIPWALFVAPPMRLHFLWPLPDSNNSFGISPTDLEGNKVTVELNANHSISEISYSNNTMTRTFPPGPAAYPDIVACMSKYIFLHPPVSFDFPIVVKNIGTAASGSNGEVTLTVGGHPYEQWGMPALQPGEERIIADVNYIWWNHGVNHFTIKVDGLNRIEETVAGEQNNILRGLIDRNRYHPEDYDEFNATHPHFCSDDPAAATPVP